MSNLNLTFLKPSISGSFFLHWENAGSLGFGEICVSHWYELWYPYMTIPWTPFFTVVNILQDHYGFFLKPDKLCTTKTLESITGGKLNNDAFVVTMNSVSTLKCFGGNCDATPSGAPFMNCEIEFLRRRGWNRQKHIYSSDNWQIANCARMVGSNSSNCSNLHQGNIGWDIEPQMEMNTS